MLSARVFAPTLVVLLIIVGAAAYSAGLQGTSSTKTTTATLSTTSTTTHNTTATATHGTTFTTTVPGQGTQETTSTTTSTLVRTFTETSTRTIGSGATTLTTTFTMTASGQRNLLQYCFSPGGHCDQVLISWISRANSSIHVLIYSFTLDDVRVALIAAHNRGVDVKVVMEKEEVNGSGAEFYNLKAAGVDIKWDSNSALMHDKLAVIDGHILLTGSFNWSAAAVSSNNENLVVIDSTAWAAAFEANFELVYGQAV